MTLPQQLTSTDIGSFNRDGFVVKRGLFTPSDMRDIIAWTSEVSARPETPGMQWMYFEHSSTDQQRILARIENFVPFHDGFEDLVNGPRMLGICSELFGEQAVLFKDKINFKLPGGAGFTPHQDIQAGWDVYASNFITVMVTIDATTRENGCLEMAAGHHDRGLIGKMWEPLAEQDIAAMAFEPLETQPGDAVFFDAFAPHRSGPNLSDQPRRVLYTTYNRLSEGDHRAAYYEDKYRNYPPDCEREPDKAYAFKV